MYCQYFRLPDNRLRCPNCGDETTRLWLTEPEKWPRRTCQVRTATGVVYVYGVGDYLSQLLMQHGARPRKDCDCNPMIRQMNKWGVEGCYVHRSEIVQQLRKGYKNTSYSQLAAFAARSAISRLAFRLSWSNPLMSLVDEAIRLKSLEGPLTSTPEKIPLGLPSSGISLIGT
jgi:hypothetical protein